MKITATIKNASWFGGGLVGEIYGDVEDRWNDGHRIRTSEVMEDLGDGLYRTRNSVYKVEFAEGQSARESGVKE